MPRAYRKVWSDSLSLLLLALNCLCGDVGDEIMEEISLRPLTSLKWPYVPDESAYPDPLKRDDPKPLQTAQYEAIGRLKFSFISSGSL